MACLLYFRARYYSPQLGQFISRDPLGYVDGMSQYRAYFVPGSMDPSGETCRPPDEESTGQIRGCVHFYDGGDRWKSDRAHGAHFRAFNKLMEGRLCKGVDIRKHPDLDIGHVGEEEESLVCLKTVIVTDHGSGPILGMAETTQIGDKSGFSASQVSNICDAMCDNAEVILMSCHAGTGRTGGSADFLLKNCPKIKAVYGCSGCTYLPQGKMPNCPKGINMIDRTGVTKTGEQDWGKVLTDERVKPEWPELN